MGKPAEQGIEALVRMMGQLRSPEGCPWDRAQTFASLKPFLVEECYEALEAVDRGDYTKLGEELGDLLLQIVFLSRLAQEMGLFTFDEVVGCIVDKLRRRHPHVFGEASAESPEEVLALWERLKRSEATEAKEDNSRLAGIARALPALQRAQKVQARAARAGFDWQTVQGAMAKVRSELNELGPTDRRREEAGSREVQDELGDVLFALVNVARFLGVDAESSLREATARFDTRFRLMEDAAERQGLTLEDLPAQALDEMWEAAKRDEKGRGARSKEAARGTGCDSTGTSP